MSFNYYNKYLDGSTHFSTDYKTFKNLISKKINNYEGDDVLELISSCNKTDYYEYTGDYNEICNIYLDIDVDKMVDNKLFNKIMKNKKYEEIETKIKNFVIDTLNDIKGDNKILKLVDCRNHRITYHGKYKFSYRLFIYTHKLEKYKILNIVKYLNQRALENKEIFDLLPFNDKKVFDESIYNKYRKMRCVNSCKPDEDEPLIFCNKKDEEYIEKSFIQYHKKNSNVELFKSDIINLDEEIKIKKYTTDGLEDGFDIVGINNKYIYNITLKEIENILNNLPSQYYQDFYKWLSVLSVIKQLYNTNIYDNDKLYKIWDEFNKQDETTYNETKNKKMFLSNNGKIFNINYLISLYNKFNDDKLAYVKKYVPFTDNLIKLDNFKEIILEKNKYMELNLADFLNNDTFIFQGITGTGKTTLMASLMSKYSIIDKNIKLLSIVDLIKLAQQQIKSFEDKKLKLKNYQDETQLKYCDMSVCCIHSLETKANNLDIENYVIYIDEINSFLESYLFNNTLNPKLRLINVILMRYISKCKKLVVSDAHINNVVMTFLKKRDTQSGIHLINKYKKYKDIKAIKYNDEELFINEVKRKIKDKEYFLFGCDSKDIIDQIYNECYDKKQKDKFIIITSEEPFDINDASKQFKEKYVFYSPSIKTGIDFSIDDKQDALLYINGNSISYQGLFQQLTRTRNIKNVKYYSNCKSNDLQFENVKEVNKYYDNLISYCNNINNDEKNLINLCSYNDDEEIKIVRNTYYNLYCEGIYIQNIQQTNKCVHFENILKQEGFILSCIGKTKQLNKDKKELMKENITKINNDNFIEFVNLAFELDKDKNNEEILDKIKSSKYIKYYKIMTYYNIKPDFLQLHKSFIMDKNIYKHTFYLRKLFLTTEAIEEQLDDKYVMTEDIKILKDCLTKIKILRNFEKSNKIKPFHINFKNEENETIININDDNFNNIKYIFGMSKTRLKPSDTLELNKLYVDMIKHIISNDLNCITSDRQQINKIKTTHYLWNNVNIKQYLNLLFSNVNMKKNIDKKLLEYVNIDINI